MRAIGEHLSVILKQLVDVKHPLPFVAEAVVRSGLLHLIQSADPEELHELSEASDRVFRERVAYFILAMRAPAKAVAAYDGGKLDLAEIKRDAMALREPS